ncbi:uncharacterized protein LOC118277105 isoform X1 [Spodoptera frugiperda]|uniref:Uncharacterized protein LOC118277105 isoform X1 n=1 Tax=Spodoptera frugiperda TaxID=7108 RepID=A0A9R0DFT5_SPOFR|nr:uncharacterized protein LOC118277105 isoform X1 [Spodoptera frugiperda]
MSEEMAVSDNTTGDEAKVSNDEQPAAPVVEPEEVATGEPSEPVAPVVEEPPAMEEDAPEPEKEPEPEIEEEKPAVKTEPLTEEIDIPLETLHTDVDLKKEELEDVKDEFETFEHNIEEDIKRGIKRRASSAFSDNGDEDFKGFDDIKIEIKTEDYSRVLERLEAEVTEASKDLVPLRTVMAAPGKASKRPRKDTDGSRPSSALSSRSDDGGTTDVSAASSPAHRGGRRSTIEMSSPLLRVPLERGWKRELVYRAALDAHSRRNADIYYYTPYGKKLRSTREVAEHLAGTGLTVENFSFFKEPLGVDDPEKEIIRDAKLIRRVDSPIAATVPPAQVEGKRTPKPKPPKGASPEPVAPAATTATTTTTATAAAKSPPAKLKVKSMGSRLSNNAAPAAPTPPAKQQKKPQPAEQKPQPAQQPATTPSNTDNNNSAAWKKPSDDKRRGRVANGAASPPTATMSPRRRGRQRADDTDHFTAFYNKAQERNYNVVVQIFQYLGMRDLAHCARVCKLWRQLSATPALWRHVRMKNSHVSDWGGLCAALKRHGTKRLDLRKMLLPQNDTVFWEQFAEHISTVDTLERIEMCRCPARAVEAVCRGLPGLRALSALAIRDALLDPSPLADLPLLHELRLKSMAGLSLTQDLRHLASLTKLQHLSLTSIKELGWCACDVIGSLEGLESLELGECTFGASFAGVLARLARLRRVRLERGTPHCAAPAILRALATRPLLTRLELVNIDVKPGFDDALAACSNVQRLLIIPTYVSQSATTNRQVLSGVLRLSASLTHLMWGVTIELLRVTELFIDQCEQAGEPKRRDVGECIPVLKPVPGCRLPAEHAGPAGPPQVEILPLPTLQRLLSQQLPHTKLKLLRIPFHATWRQSLADFQ